MEYALVNLHELVLNIAENRLRCLCGIELSYAKAHPAPSSQG